MAFDRDFAVTQGLPVKWIRVYDDVLYRHDNRSFDPVGRDYAIDEFADLAANNGEPVYFRL